MADGAGAALLALGATPGFFSLGTELVTLTGAALLALTGTLDATPGFCSLGADISAGATLLALAGTAGAMLCAALADANGRDPILDAARTTRGADTGSIDSGMTDRGRGRRAGTAIGAALGTALCTTLCTTLLALADAIGAALLALAGATLAGATLAGATLADFASLCNSSCTIIDEEGAIPGFLSFLGGSCATNGTDLIEGATPGFLSFFGSALGSGRPSAIGTTMLGAAMLGAAMLCAAMLGAAIGGATPGFFSLFGASIGCSCATRGRG